MPLNRTGPKKTTKERTLFANFTIFFRTHNRHSRNLYYDSLPFRPCDIGIFNISIFSKRRRHVTERVVYAHKNTFENL